MHKVLVAGAGKIGCAIACILAQSGDYQVTLIDRKITGPELLRLTQHFPHFQTLEINVQDQNALIQLIQKQKINALISSLPYFCNLAAAETAKQCKIPYFDLTEDINVTEAIAQLAHQANTAFVPQCGLAPGFISIAAYSLLQNFDQTDSLRLRVGALPQYPNNALHYALTWSTEGLINQYANPCHAIENYQETLLPALEGLENLQIDGLNYEAFNTSGGLGSLVKTCIGKLRQLNYKTLRYPGHCEKMKFLIKDLKLNENRECLKHILEYAIPKTYQDVVIIFASVTGKINHQWVEKSFVKKIYPQKIADLQWTAIQISTASGLCAVVDLILSNPHQYKGLILQEQFTLDQILNNRFGSYFNRDDHGYS